MTSLQSFLRFNHLRQVDLVRYLGISRPYMSQLVNGIGKLSPEKINMLLNNDKGWDVSMLIEELNALPKEEPEIILLREKVKYLEHMLAEKERLINVLMMREGLKSVPPVSLGNDQTI